MFVTFDGDKPVIDIGVKQMIRNCNNFYHPNANSSDWNNIEIPCDMKNISDSTTAEKIYYEVIDIYIILIKK